MRTCVAGNSYRRYRPKEETNMEINRRIYHTLLTLFFPLESLFHFQLLIPGKKPLLTAKSDLNSCLEEDKESFQAKGPS